MKPSQYILITASLVVFIGGAILGKNHIKTQQKTAPQAQNMPTAIPTMDIPPSPQVN